MLKATEIARKMVTQWGLSDLGPLTFSQEEGEVFLGRGTNQSKEVSDKTAQKIDEEIRKIIDRNFATAQDILNDNLPTLHLMADALMKYETIDAEQIQEIMDGNEPSPPDNWDAPSKPKRKPKATKPKKDSHTSKKPTEDDPAEEI